MAARYVLSLIGAALIAGILQSFVKEGSCARVLKILCGLFLMVTALKPLKDLQIPTLEDWTASWNTEAEAAVREGEERYAGEYGAVIRQRLEAYILDKAAQLGLSVQVQLTLTADYLPESALLTGQATRQQKQAMESILESDLGIPKEKQQWNGS